MKISICIPQYERINFLMKSLKIISQQDYDDIEVVISDDCSHDDTVDRIEELMESYCYPIVFSKNEKNLGYDRNLRKSLELATGDYMIVLGNDDSLFLNNAISFLVDFLKDNNYPAVGYCNFVEYANKDVIIKRATETRVIGSGEKIAIQNYTSFTFVGGLIFKRDWFEKVNTDEFDNSVFVQIYLIIKIILRGGELFSISEPLVLKDLWVDNRFRHSYRDRLQRSFKDFKPLNAGLYSVGHVIVRAFRDAGSKYNIAFYYLRRMYIYTYPHWILDYKSNNALVAALGLVVGLFPTKNPVMKEINFMQKMFIYGIYTLSTIASILFPSFLFARIKPAAYNFKKRYLK